MPLPRRRAPEAVYELIDLLKLAQGAVKRAQVELQGEASDLASRLSRQVAYLRGVSELLEHEATRSAASGSADQAEPTQRLTKPVSPRIVTSARRETADHTSAKELR